MEWQWKVNGGRATERVLRLGCNANGFNVNANGNVNNERPARGNGHLPPAGKPSIAVKTYKHLFEKLCLWENLEDAYWKARKGKSSNPKIKEFEEHWRLHLVTLMKELQNRVYAPQSLRRFVLRDPKTRVICVSEFRDRVVHHALVNILQPIFQPRFIHDSYASQKGKGTLAALHRFGGYMRKVSENGRRVQGSSNNNVVAGFVWKADIAHYFDTVDHAILLGIIQKRVHDEGVLWLVKTILSNYHSGRPGKGMPLGNWTSQFFANIYLNELDQFVKHRLRVGYYIRYVDDVVILEKSKTKLQEYQHRIRALLHTLQLSLHKNKCRIIPLGSGIPMLGFLVFYHYKKVRRRNIRRIKERLAGLLDEYARRRVSAQTILAVMHGWNSYAMQGNTYKLRRELTEAAMDQLEKMRCPEYHSTTQAAYQHPLPLFEDPPGSAGCPSPALRSAS
ncbi:group II intron reverse transcriptase domain-containing protein [Candidatus Woesearchaeota archaeon]|nr:group II intron reverse transcriptase domain-containing protein [Candidatus Woesearchaeota archaeon]